MTKRTSKIEIYRTDHLIKDERHYMQKLDVELDKRLKDATLML